MNGSIPLRAPPYLAHSSQNAELAKLVIESGAEIGVTGVMGFGPRLAVRVGYAEPFTLLLKAVAGPDSHRNWRKFVLTDQPK